MDKIKEEKEANSVNSKEENIALNKNEGKKEKEDIVTKLENLEEIKDPVKKADEKCKIMPTEYGYKYNGPEPTRYGDWDVKGKCVDF